MAALVFGLYFHSTARPGRSLSCVNVERPRRRSFSRTRPWRRGPGPLSLFGVLSIIRRGQNQIADEIAYYFASLALSLLTGMSSAVTPLLGGLIADPHVASPSATRS